VKTVEDNQTEISMRLLWATRPRAEDCEVLEALDVPVEPGPAGSQKRRIFVAIDSEGYPSIENVAVA
jgi:molecular chaperone DnaK (HSP70)